MFERMNLPCDFTCLSAPQLTQKKFLRLFAMSGGIIPILSSKQGPMLWSDYRTCCNWWSAKIKPDNSLQGQKDLSHGPRGFPETHRKPVRLNLGKDAISEQIWEMCRMSLWRMGGGGWWWSEHAILWKGSEGREMFSQEMEIWRDCWRDTVFVTARKISMLAFGLQWQGWKWDSVKDVSESIGRAWLWQEGWNNQMETSCCRKWDGHNCLKPRLCPCGGHGVLSRKWGELWAGGAFWWERWGTVGWLLPRGRQWLWGVYGHWSPHQARFLFYTFT